MSDEIEIIPMQIPCANYEAKVLRLIETLLEVDEKLFPGEFEQVTGESPKEAA